MSTVLLLFGGESSEHEVSIASASNVYEAIDKTNRTVQLVFIDKTGAWWLVDKVSNNANSQSAKRLNARLGEGCFTAEDGTKVQPDIVFPLLHGKYGEDGTVQGLLDLMHLPYVGCGVEASALAMDKMRTKLLLEHYSRYNIKTAPWISLHRFNDWRQQVESLCIVDDAHGYSDLTERLGNGPWFVKPSRAGSSVGVSRVTKTEDLASAAELAFNHDDTILIEQAIVGHEIEVAVLGNGSDLLISSPGEVIPGDVFYSYEDKYAEDSSSRTSLELPDHLAPLSETIRKRAGKVYQAIGCRGLARIDFFVTDALEIYFNEINTIPGFTNISMYPKLWQAAGIEYPELIERLLATANS